jgi:hypothetical protein
MPRTSIKNGASEAIVIWRVNCNLSAQVLFTSSSAAIEAMQGDVMWHAQVSTFHTGARYFASLILVVPITKMPDSEIPTCSTSGSKS